MKTLRLLGLLIMLLLSTPGAALSSSTESIGPMPGSKIAKISTMTFTQSSGPSFRLTTYTSLALGFSVRYPADWQVEEAGRTVVFTSEGGLSMATAASLPGLEEFASPTFVNLLLALTLQAECNDAEIPESSSVVVNGIEWERMELTCTLEKVPFTLLIYTTARKGTVYLFVGGAHSELFSQREALFQAMIESFHFLPGAPPTPTRTPTPGLLPDCVVTTRALNVRTGPGLEYPIIAGVYRGDELDVIGKANDCRWLKVTTPRGASGWVSGLSRYVTRNVSCVLVPPAPIPPTPTPRPPTRTPDTHPTVSLPVRNNTNGVLYLSLSGPARYDFTIQSGNHHVSVVPGTYSYTGRGCGGATKSGTYNISWRIEDWTWWCKP